MAIASLVVGRVYFQVTYQDPKLTRPIILSFEYLGKDIYGEPASERESQHYFSFLPPFHALDENGQEIEEPALHIFTQESAGSLHDLDGLLEELESRKAGWSRSGGQKQ